MRLSRTNLANLKYLTGKELDLYLFLILRQDKNSFVKGIDYRQIKSYLRLSDAHIYRAKENLIKKGFINCYSEYDNWIFELNKNSLDYCQNNGGYINLNRDFFRNLEFLNLSRNEKIIYLNIVSLSDFKHRKIKITYKKMQEWTSATITAIRKYVKTLCRLFDDKIKLIINTRAVNHLIEIRNKNLFEKSKDTEILLQKEQEIIYITKILKIKKKDRDFEAVKDVAGLYNQYSKKVNDKDTLNDYIINSVYACIRNHGKVLAKYINKVVSIEIDKFKNRKTNHYAKNKRNENIKIIYQNNIDLFFSKEKFNNSKTAKEELEELICYQANSNIEKEALATTIQALTYLLTINNTGYLFNKTNRTIQSIYDSLSEICSNNGVFKIDKLNYLINDFISLKAINIIKNNSISKKYPYITESLYNFITNNEVRAQTQVKTKKFANHEQRNWNFEELDEKEQLYLRKESLSADEYIFKIQEIENKYKNSSKTQKSFFIGAQTQAKINKFANHEQRNWNFEELDEKEQLYLRKESLSADEYIFKIQEIENKYKNSSKTQKSFFIGAQTQAKINKFANHEQRNWNFEELERLEREYLKNI